MSSSHAFNSTIYSQVPSLNSELSTAFSSANSR
ncbi:hypothetical protein DQG23_26160 [Paenibacillus contaminans]|uniref:Uncharacterized protein n=1 Tax=Paenibacillus contaminans TaxID=450362 RepID=A0A329MCY9_9BACL|nr:hypothetical protein DQG23_26160 [Paenibacillus contaminans]